MCRRFSWTSWWSAWRRNRKLNWQRNRDGTAKLSSWSLVGPSRGLNSHICSSLLSCVKWRAFWIEMALGMVLSLQNCLGLRSLEQWKSASAWVLATTGAKFIRIVHHDWYYISFHLALAQHLFTDIPYLPHTLPYTPYRLPYTFRYTLPCRVLVYSWSCNCMPPSHFIQILSLAERQNEYDDEEEFWVTVKETGKKIESTSYSEIHSQEREAPILKPYNLANASIWFSQQSWCLLQTNWGSSGMHGTCFQTGQGWTYLRVRRWQVRHAGRSQD